MEFEQLIPHLLTGVFAGLVAWGGVRIELRWHRSMIDNLRYSVHDPHNPKNLRSVAQDHESRISLIEREHDHGRAKS